MVTVFKTQNGYIILKGSHTYVSGNETFNSFVATSLDQVARILHQLLNQ